MGETNDMRRDHILWVTESVSQTLSGMGQEWLCLSTWLHSELTNWSVLSSGRTTVM